ncbi:potassium channel subfamily K member 1-like [Convolutriloba macropyga]|uniref:potassium channel subfamily K member 1-like n=1 Tax=Convolutriloba macropyga TaxID=536237 RepID=UPI003F5274EF
MTIYMMLGSLAFSAIELDREKENLRDLKKIMETQAFQFVDFLLNETAHLVCEANSIQAQSCQVDAFNKSFYHQHMFDFVNEILEKLDVHEFKVGADESEVIPNWEWSGAFYFCITTVTTIGYGNFTPSSKSGQVLVIVFSIIGIPGFLFTCSQVCHLHLHLSFKIRRRFCIYTYRRVAIYYLIVTIVAFLLLFVLPLPVFIIGQDLSAVSSFYFIFVSLSTIGYGDINPTDPARKESEFRVLFSFGLWIYMLIGLSLFGNVIRSLQDAIAILSNKFNNVLPCTKKIGRQVGATETTVKSNQTELHTEANGDAVTKDTVPKTGTIILTQYL